MCGIVGFVEQKPCDLGAKLLDRLSTLEYRGYDSAGLIVGNGKRLQIIKSVGELSKLKEKLNQKHLVSSIGMAHTRWATHGAPTEKNALPIITPDGSMAIVFNGIVENHLELRRNLTTKGFSFSTDNDAETLLIHIFSHYMGNTLDDTRIALESVKGRYAFTLMHLDQPNALIAAKRGSPLIIGRGPSGNSVASDLQAIHKDFHEIYYIEEESIAMVEAHKINVISKNGTKIDPIFISRPTGLSNTLKSEFETYTLQEIYEQPEAIMKGLQAADASRIPLESIAEKIDRVTLIACGTAYFSCMIGKSLMEQFAGIPCDANMASEFHQGSPILNERTMAVFVSQSGETADTLACIELAKKKGSLVVVICNVVTSTMARQADILLPICCGPEIGVASTKAYTGMLLQLTFMSLAVGIKRRHIPQETWMQHMLAAQSLPEDILSILKTRGQIERLARMLRERRNFAFMGRGLLYPTACEGALKLRELSYRNAEGFSGGELKHGTLALIEPGYPVIAIAPRVQGIEKIIGNIQEVKARGARLIGVISEGDHELESLCDESIRIPPSLEAFMPILSIVPLQLFAYDLAKTLGRNIDRPRNLAKSVTVE
jgi:glutamine---fructose-6-phosphate transaminase (isomerizing)